MVITKKKSYRYIPHPYCIYMRRPNTIGKNPTGEFAVNNYGFGNTEPTKLGKDPSKTRIICIGGSTTEMVWKTADNTYPNHLGGELGKYYEVLNAGVSGWTTAEMLINFELRLLDFKPDIIVIYAGFNDVKGAAMYDDFKTDYSHARMPLGFTPTKENKNLLNNILPAGAIWRKDRVPDIAIEAFRRNIISMIAIALYNNIKPLVVKMNINPDNCYPENMLDGIKRNMKAIKNEVPNFLEINGLTKDDFIDGCHFNTSGMKKMGKAISQVIKQL